MKKQARPVENIQPKQIRQRIASAQVNTSITAVREATKNLGLVIPSGVRLVKTEPWLTHLSVG